jgi:hypothetical protein
MLIMGCDYHPGFQQIAFVDTETGEVSERRLTHREEAEQFYRNLKDRGLTVRVGMEASGQARWFERLLIELQFELWIGDAAVIRHARGLLCQACHRLLQQPAHPIRGGLNLDLSVPSSPADGDPRP